jgi:hypothetical protein
MSPNNEVSMEWWSIGVMECWSIEKDLKFLRFQYYSTPLLHDSKLGLR